MERHLSFNSKLLTRINYALLDLFEGQARDRVEYSIPGNVDLSQVSFSFGEYKGRLINQIWKLDKRYIKNLARQPWLEKYPIEEIAIHTLLENQRLFRS
jgi:hypothetical protein